MPKVNNTSIKKKKNLILAHYPSLFMTSYLTFYQILKQQFVYNLPSI